MSLLFGLVILLPAEYKPRAAALPWKIAKGGNIYSNDDVITPKNLMQIEIF